MKQIVIDLIDDDMVLIQTLEGGRVTARAAAPVKAANTIGKRVAEQLTAPEPRILCEVKAPYGYCPVCGAPGESRERRPNGNDTCVNGHIYGSRAALTVPPGLRGLTMSDIVEKHVPAETIIDVGPDCPETEAALMRHMAGYDQFRTASDGPEPGSAVEATAPTAEEMKAAMVDAKRKIEADDSPYYDGDGNLNVGAKPAAE